MKSCLCRTLDPLSRREFARLALAAGAAAGLAGVPLIEGGRRALGAAAGDPKSPKPARTMHLLLLGGTAFTGPKMAEYAKARGHKVTLFNRGKTEKRIGMIEDVEKLYGNRDPDKTAEETDPASPKGLGQLAGRKFDAIIDTSGSYPRHVRASAELLRDSGFYLFFSTVSVYKSHEKAADEEDAVGTVEDTTSENLNAAPERYGPLKALCEKEVEKVFGQHCAIVRPGFIVGPGDLTDRFAYWPVRASEGGEMLCPGDGSDPVQFIDNRDLAEWCVRMCENQTPGTFNAVGPSRVLTMKELIDACLLASTATGGTNAEPVWVPAPFLEEHQLSIGGDIPIWGPGTGPNSGFHRRSYARAVAAGLTYRPVVDTCTATLEWWPKELARRQRATREVIEEAKKAGKPEPKLPDPLVLRAGMSREREREILKAWHDRKG